MERDRNEEVGAAAYHIDKFCTGGDENDWKAAEAIVAELVDPVVAERDRLRGALILARTALHRACLQIGSTEGYRADFGAINAAAALSPESNPEGQ